MTCILSGTRNSYCTRKKRFPTLLQENFDRYFDGNSVTWQFHTINTIIIAHSPLYNVTKMVRKKALVRDRFKKAAEMILKAPVFIVP